MQVLSASLSREWDQYTILNEPVSSIELMERAAMKCYAWIIEQGWEEKKIRIFCGKGNNGGDGLAIARLLMQRGFSVSVYILEFGKIGTDDFQFNLQRLHEMPLADIHFIQSEETIPAIGKDEIVIDALFGTGLNDALHGLAEEVVKAINQSGAITVAIDVPSGLFIDRSSSKYTVVHATHTLSFQSYKLALLVQENAPFIGNVHILDIGLDQRFLGEIEISDHITDTELIKRIYKPRDPFSHKGSFGHALLITGSEGKIGASVLAAKACIHSGAGLTTVFIPRCGYSIMQTAVPEAMVINSEHEKFLSGLPSDIEHYHSIGIGPGIGTIDETRKMFSFIIRRYHKPLVIDADALNCLSMEKELMMQLHSHSILTPHPKEFDRLFGKHENDFERLNTAKSRAREYDIIIILKGHHTFIATPVGENFFNNTGNAGLAKGGSGDVLTGILTALIAQGYSPSEAAIFGVWLHGLAGDLAAASLSQEYIAAGDLIRYLSKAFKQSGNTSPHQ